MVGYNESVAAPVLPMKARMTCRVMAAPGADPAVGGLELLTVLERCRRRGRAGGQITGLNSVTWQDVPQLQGAVTLSL